MSMLSQYPFKIQYKFISLQIDCLGMLIRPYWASLRPDSEVSQICPVSLIIPHIDITYLIYFSSS